MRNYLNITDTEYDAILVKIVKEEGASIIQIPGVYEAVTDHFNKEILKRYKYGGNKGE